MMARKVGFTSDYTRLICHSLERRGYLKFAAASACYFLAKEHDRFKRNSESKSAAVPKKLKNISAQGPLRRSYSKARGKKKVKKFSNSTAGLDALRNATPQEKEKLVAAGYKSIADIAETRVNWLIQGLGIRLDKAAHWINQARRQTGMIGKGNQRDKE